MQGYWLIGIITTILLALPGWIISIIILCQKFKVWWRKFKAWRKARKMKKMREILESIKKMEDIEPLQQTMK